MISSDKIMHRLSIILAFNLVFNCLARPTDGRSNTQRVYLHSFPNGTTRYCLWVECDPGFEVKVCEKPYSADQCQPCIPPFIQPDKTNSESSTMCYKVTCPEFSKLDENWKCICDTDIGYYGEFYYDCKYKRCPEGEKLTIRGVCVDKEKYLIPVLTIIPEPKPKFNNTQDKNMTNLKPVKISGDNEDGKATHSEDKSTGSVEDKKENDERTTKVLVAAEVNFHLPSFLYGCLALFAVFVILVAVIIVYRICKKQKNEHVLKTQTQNLIPPSIQDKFKLKKNRTWKHVPEGSIPMWFKFPGRGRFNKPPGFKPTQYAVLPHKLRVGESIGILHVEKEPWGTGFVVGNGHLMTCLHTIIFMLGIRAETEDGIQEEINQHIHKVMISFHFNLASSSNDETRFGFEQYEMYFDISLDVIVLKLDRSCINNQHIPPGPLTRFCDLLPSSQFDFFGHPLGKEKKVDENCRIKTFKESMIEEMRCRLAEYLRGKGYNSNDFPDPYYGVMNDGSYLFTTLFVAGGSGSPGITFCEMTNPDEQTYEVGTMLCGEYPNFASNDIPHEDLNTDLKIQFGTKMSSIFSSMKQRNPLLLREVFKFYPQQWDQ